ncbi:hypothetical protein R0K17_23490, partial [Planococcus sp. SIMBA_143]
MMNTIEAIRPFVPQKEKRRKSYTKIIMPFIKNSYQEIFYFSPLFWLVNCLFLFICSYAVFIADQDPYVTLMLLA